MILSEFLYDALRFIMWIGFGIQEAPLQVYFAALVFAPEKSIIRGTFANEMQARIEVKLGLDKNWGPLLQILEGHTNIVESMAFSPKGNLLASGSWDNTVRIWDGKTGQLLRTLEAHSTVSPAWPSRRRVFYSRPVLMIRLCLYGT